MAKPQPSTAITASAAIGAKSAVSPVCGMLVPGSTGVGVGVGTGGTGSGGLGPEGTGPGGTGPEGSGCSWFIVIGIFISSAPSGKNIIGKDSPTNSKLS